jgi:hypothetical protein
MAKLKHYQRDQIRDWFCPSPGYVLDFSNKTFADFFEDHFELNIYSDAFSEKGTSKFNRLLAFIEISPPHLVIEALKILWQRLNSERNDQLQQATHSMASDAWTTNAEYVQALYDSAAREDFPFEKLISEIASLPSHSAVPHLQKVSSEWTLDTLEREISRAFENLERDPEAAVTASCAMLESICRSILFARELPLPKTMDIKSLYKEVREPLGLSPSKELPNSEIEGDIRSILSALSNSIQGVGALRTHAGTAHGRERGFRRLDTRIARLGVNTATALALFLVETWEKKFPDDKLGPVDIQDSSSG